MSTTPSDLLDEIQRCLVTSPIDQDLLADLVRRADRYGGDIALMTFRLLRRLGSLGKRWDQIVDLSDKMRFPLEVFIEDYRERLDLVPWVEWRRQVRLGNRIDARPFGSRTDHRLFLPEMDLDRGTGRTTRMALEILARVERVRGHKTIALCTLNKFHFETLVESLRQASGGLNVSLSEVAFISAADPRNLRGRSDLDSVFVDHGVTERDVSGRFMEEIRTETMGEVRPRDRMDGLLPFLGTFRPF